MCDVEQIEIVRKVQAYIEMHLNEPMTLAELAKVSGYSPWHIERIFKTYLEKTPFEYIRALRLSKAAISLRDKKSQKILDVALDYVFDSHEGFTRAFSKQFGIAPKAYQKRSKPIPLFLPYPAYSEHYQSLKRSEKQMADVEKTTQTVFVQVIERPERKAVVKRGKQATDYFEYCDEVGCDVWGILVSIKEALYEPAGFWLPEILRPAGTSSYIQGVEVPSDYTGDIPEGFEVMTLPPCLMMIFQGPTYDDEFFEDAIGEVQNAIEKFDPKLYGFEWSDNDGPRFQLEPQGYRGYIEGRPVRR
jgi:AraC family transcriptional regulator